MLKFDIEKRITANEALQHPYLTGILLYKLLFEKRHPFLINKINKDTALFHY